MERSHSPVLIPIITDRVRNITHGHIIQEESSAGNKIPNKIINKRIIKRKTCSLIREENAQKRAIPELTIKRPPSPIKDKPVTIEELRNLCILKKSTIITPIQTSKVSKDVKNTNSQDYSHLIALKEPIKITRPRKIPGIRKPEINEPVVKKIKQDPAKTEAIRRDIELKKKLYFQSIKQKKLEAQALKDAINLKKENLKKFYPSQKRPVKGEAAHKTLSVNKKLNEFKDFRPTKEELKLSSGTTAAAAETPHELINHDNHSFENNENVPLLQKDVSEKKIDPLIFDLNSSSKVNVDDSNPSINIYSGIISNSNNEEILIKDKPLISSTASVQVDETLELESKKTWQLESKEKIPVKLTSNEISHQDSGKVHNIDIEPLVENNNGDNSFAKAPISEILLSSNEDVVPENILLSNHHYLSQNQSNDIKDANLNISDRNLVSPKSQDNYDNLSSAEYSDFDLESSLRIKVNNAKSEIQSSFLNDESTVDQSIATNDILKPQISKIKRALQEINVCLQAVCSVETQDETSINYTSDYLTDLQSNVITSKAPAKVSFADEKSDCISINDTKDDFFLSEIDNIGVSNLVKYSEDLKTETEDIMKSGIEMLTVQEEQKKLTESETEQKLGRKLLLKSLHSGIAPAAPSANNSCVVKPKPDYIPKFQTNSDKKILTLKENYKSKDDLRFMSLLKGYIVERDGPTKDIIIESSKPSENIAKTTKRQQDPKSITVPKKYAKPNTFNYRTKTSRFVKDDSSFSSGGSSDADTSSLYMPSIPRKNNRFNEGVSIPTLNKPALVQGDLGTTYRGEITKKQMMNPDTQISPNQLSEMLASYVEDLEFKNDTLLDVQLLNTQRELGKEAFKIARLKENNDNLKKNQTENSNDLQQAKLERTNISLHGVSNYDDEVFDSISSFEQPLLAKRDILYSWDIPPKEKENSYNLEYKNETILEDIPSFESKIESEIKEEISAHNDSHKIVESISDPRNIIEPISILNQTYAPNTKQKDKLEIPKIETAFTTVNAADHLTENNFEEEEKILDEMYDKFAKCVDQNQPLTQEEIVFYILDWGAKKDAISKITSLKDKLKPDTGAAERDKILDNISFIRNQYFAYRKKNALDFKRTLQQKSATKKILKYRTRKLKESPIRKLANLSSDSIPEFIDSDNASENASMLSEDSISGFEKTSISKSKDVDSKPINNYSYSMEDYEFENFSSDNNASLISERANKIKNNYLNIKSIPDIIIKSNAKTDSIISNKLKDESSKALESGAVSSFVTSAPAIFNQTESISSLELHTKAQALKISNDHIESQPLIASPESKSVVAEENISKSIALNNRPDFELNTGELILENNAISSNFNDDIAQSTMSDVNALAKEDEIVHFEKVCISVPEKDEVSDFIEEDIYEESFEDIESESPIETEKVTTQIHENELVSELDIISNQSTSILKDEDKIPVEQKLESKIEVTKVEETQNLTNSIISNDHDNHLESIKTPFVDSSANTNQLEVNEPSLNTIGNELDTTLNVDKTCNVLQVEPESDIIIEYAESDKEVPEEIPQIQENESKIDYSNETIDDLVSIIFKDILNSSFKDLPIPSNFEFNLKVDRVTNDIYQTLLNDVSYVTELFSNKKQNRKPLALNLPRICVSPVEYVAISQDQIIKLVTDLINSIKRPIEFQGYDKAPSFTDEAVAIFTNSNPDMRSRDEIQLLLYLTIECVGDLFIEHDHYRDSFQPYRTLKFVEPKSLTHEMLLIKTLENVNSSWNYNQLHGENLDSLLIKELKQEKKNWKLLEQDADILLKNNITNIILNELIMDTCKCILDIYEGSSSNIL